MFASVTDTLSMIIIINNIVTLQNTVSSILLTLSFISGGVSSGTNAADVQDYIDLFHCDDLDDFPFLNIPIVQDTCDDLMNLRGSMVASSVSSLICDWASEDRPSGHVKFDESFQIYCFITNDLFKPLK